MAGLRKDVELIFRGEDRASPTIKKVRDSVSDLAKSINDQIAAAERGEGSVDELAKAYRSLKDAQGDVGEIAKIASAYENVSTKLTEQSAKVEEAKRKSAELTAQLAAAERPTKRLANAYEANERKLQAAIATEERYKNELRELGATLDAAGGDSRDFAATQDRIRQAAIETARAIRDAAAAMDQFKGKQAQGRAGVAAQEEALAFNQMAAGSGLPQAQINFISTLENRLEALGLAIREDQASMAALNREFGDRAATDAAQRVRSMAVALDEAEQAATRLKATQGFRQMAQEIEAGARDISRFGAQLDTNAAAGQRFADSIQAILAPTQAASATLQGLDAVISQSESVTEGAKRRMSEYNAEVNNLTSATAAIQGMSRLIDQFHAQDAAVAATRAEFDRAQAEVIQLSQAMQSAAAPTQEMANALTQAQAKLDQAGAAMQRENTKLAQLEQKLEAAGIDSRNLAAAQDQLTNAATRAAAAQGVLANKTSGQGAFLGLRPHEMQNLGFQVNDIIVSIASGQAPMRVFLQQGAQIGQIIPGAFQAIIRYAGPLAALTAVVLTFAAAMKQAGDEARDMEIGGSIVAQMGDGVSTTAAEFADLAEKMADAGVKGEDLRGKLVQLAADGLSTEEMDTYIETAKAVSEVTGVDMAEALEKVREHFQGGMEDILALDDAENIYNATQLQTIQNLYDQGKAEEARTYALNIYKQNQQDVANLQRGPWKTAVDQMSQAWSNFLTWLNTEGPFKNVQRNLSNIARGAAYVAALLNELSKGNYAGAHAAATKTATADLAARAAAPSGGGRAGGGGGGYKPSPALRDAQLELETARATTPVARRNLEIKKLRNEAAELGLRGLEKEQFISTKLATFNIKEDQRAAKAATAAGKKRDAAARKAEAARKRAAAAAAAEARKIESMEDSITRSLDSLDSKVGRKAGQDLSEKLDAIDSEYQKLYDAIDEFEARTGGKGLIDGRTISAARERVDLQVQELKNFAQLEHYEKAINELEKTRKEQLDAIADRVARGIITPEQGLAESKGVIDAMAVQITQMAQDGLIFAQSIAGANPSPQLQALIAQFATAVQNNSGGQNTREYQGRATDAIEKAESGLNEIIARRNSLIAHENTLVELGLQSRREAEGKVQAHYERTSALIHAQIANVRRLAAAYGDDLTPEMKLYFENLEARLNEAAIQATYVDTRFNELKDGFNNIISSNVISFIDSVAQALANLATQKEGVLGTLGAIGMAFLDMIAKTLQGIAMLIIQMIILDAVDKMTGGLVKPLLRLYGGVPVKHSGGIIGMGGDNRTRNVSPLIFAGAPEYHSGGIAGLAPNETAAILKRGEEVLTETDPRHRLNGGLSPAAPAGGGIRQVLAVGDDEIAGAMQGAAGERVVLTHIRRNKVTLRQELNS